MKSLKLFAIRMIQNLKRLFKKQYTTLNQIEISKSALLHNYSRLSTLDASLCIAPVLKSNAYGHGIIEIARILDSQKAPFLCVDSLFEAYQLQKAHIKTPVLIMGYTNPENFKVKRLPFQVAVWDIETVEALNRYQPGSKIHIFVDTGMHREGVPLAKLSEFLSSLKQFKSLKVMGLMSHLASAKSHKDPLFRSQIKKFKLAREMIEKAGFKPRWFHISASGALLNSETRKVISQISNLVRCGISLYGFVPQPLRLPHKLQPVLRFKTQIIQIKQIKKDSKIGYDGTYTAKKNLSLGVLPVGYNDGVDRRLSSKGFVLVYGVKCKIAGRISMN